MRLHGLTTARIDGHGSSGPACRLCGERRPERFYRKPKSECKQCFNRRRAQQIQRNRAIVVEKMGGKCQLCGYARCEAALELHHRVADEKDPKYNTIKNGNIERLLREAAKCILVCANCHREIHAGIVTIAPIA